MILFPDHILKLKSYKPGKSPEELKKEYGWKKMAVLWNNENNLGASPKALEEIKKALDRSHLYPDPAVQKLRSMIAEKIGRKMEHICVENGSEAILGNIMQAFFFPGEEILTSEGSFVAIYIWAQSHNVPVVKVPLTSTYEFDLEKIKNNISDQTKAIYLSNPNNPTGAMIPRKELREFVEDVPDDVMVIVDEAYAEYANNLSDEYPNSILYTKPNVVTLRTFSKAYGIAGIRLGYAVGSPELISALNKVKMTFAPSNVAQAAGIGAIQDDEFLDNTVRSNTYWLKKFYQALRENDIPFVPSYANFVMVDLKTERKAEKFTEALMKSGVLVRHLKAFGLPHCVRITVGTPEENKFFIEQLPGVVNEL